MASVKDLRTKPLSSMSASELKSYIKAGEKAGYTLSTSKDLGKAQDLLKVLEPNKYDDKQVQSATQKLLTNTTPQTQQNLGLVSTASKSNTNAGSSSLMPGGSGSSSAIDLNSIYENALADSNTTTLEEELNAKKMAKDAASADINDNPFYTEATRVGKIAKLDEKANNEINTLQDQITQAKADAQVKVNIATQQYNIDSQEYQNNLSKLNTLISSGAIAGASSSDISSIALATGMSTSMINSIITKVKEGNRSLQTTTDNAGNVTIFDANTGQIVSTIKGIGKADTTGTTESSVKRANLSNATAALSSVTGNDGYVSNENFNAVRQAFIARGGDLEEFNQNFYNYANPKYYSSYNIPEYIYDPDKYKSSGTVINVK
jgi:hypothetical protein